MTPTELLNKKKIEAQTGKFTQHEFYFSCQKSEKESLFEFRCHSQENQICIILDWVGLLKIETKREIEKNEIH